MSFAGAVRQSLLKMSYPALATYYRSYGAKDCPSPILKALGVADPSYRTDFYTLSRLVKEIASRGGLIAECGVYRGSTLLGMAHTLSAIGAQGWQLLGFDSFEGFPEPASEDALPDGTLHPRAVKGVFQDTSREQLQQKIDALGFERQIVLVKGYFEQTLSAWADREFALAHIDCDLYPSYMTCLEFFYPRMRPGAVMVFDEYDFSAPVYPGAQKAIDSFFANKPEKIQKFAEAENPRYFIVKQ